MKSMPCKPHVTHCETQETRSKTQETRWETHQSHEIKALARETTPWNPYYKVQILYEVSRPKERTACSIEQEEQRLWVPKSLLRFRPQCSVVALAIVKMSLLLSMITRCGVVLRECCIVVKV